MVRGVTVVQRVKTWASDSKSSARGTPGCWKDGLDLGRENEDVRIGIVVQRPDAHAVACEKELLSCRIPYGESELAVDPVQAVRTVLFKQVQNDLGIGLGGEAVALLDKLCLELDVIEGFTVENDP